MKTDFIKFSSWKRDLFYVTVANVTYFMYQLQTSLVFMFQLQTWLILCNSCKRDLFYVSVANVTYFM